LDELLLAGNNEIPMNSVEIDLHIISQFTITIIITVSIPDEIQSPLGILALISTVPKVKLKDSSVVSFADAIGWMISPDAVAEL